MSFASARRLADLQQRTAAANASLIVLHSMSRSAYSALKTLLDTPA